MKIAFLTPEFIEENGSHGGLSNYLLRITKELSEQGHSVSVFTLSNNKDKIKKGNLLIYRVAIDKNEIFYKIAIKLKKLLPYSVDYILTAYFIGKNFKIIAKQEKFDIIQSASFFAPGLFLNQSKINTPIVSRVSGVFYKYLNFNNYNNYLDIFLVRIIEKIALKKSFSVYAPCLKTSKFLNEKQKVKTETILPPYFKIGEECLAGNNFLLNDFIGIRYFLFYGRVSKIKGVFFIADNMSDILNKNKDLYLIFIGDLENYLDRTSKEIILETLSEYRDRILFYSVISHKKLIPVIRDALAVLIPSSFDNLPNTLIESMSLGKIVVTTHESGGGQLIVDDENGFIIDFGDSNKFKKILNIILIISKSKKDEISNKATDSIKKGLGGGTKNLINYFEKQISLFKKKHE